MCRAFSSGPIVLILIEYTCYILPTRVTRIFAMAGIPGAGNRGMVHLVYWASHGSEDVKARTQD